MEIAAGIKNIIFDLGGVLLNLDYQLTVSAFKKLGIEEKFYSQSQQQKLFDEYEKGLISSDDFRKGLIKLIGREIEFTHLDTAWNAMLLEMPGERIKLLEKLKSRYRLFLLSNTNDIHITAYTAYMKKAFGYENLSHIFEKEYYSYKVGMRKPDKEIFELVLNENNLNPAETLFIDDSPQHIEGASLAGINSCHLQPPETILHLFPGI